MHIVKKFAGGSKLDKGQSSSEPSEEYVKQREESKNQNSLKKLKLVKKKEFVKNKDAERPKKTSNAKGLYTPSDQELKLSQVLHLQNTTFDLGENVPNLGIVSYNNSGPNRYWNQQNARVLKGFNQDLLMKFDTNHDSEIDLKEVKDMQTKLGLVADGKLGSGSIAKLKSYLQGDAYNKLKSFENPLAKQRRLAKEKKELDKAKDVINDSRIEAGNIASDIDDESYEPYDTTKEEFYSKNRFLTNLFKQNNLAPIMGYYIPENDSIYTSTFIKKPSRIDSTHQMLNDSIAIILRNSGNDSIPLNYYSAYNMNRFTPQDSIDFNKYSPYAVNDLVIPVKTNKEKLLYSKRFKELGLGLRDAYRAFKPDTTQVVVPDSIPRDTILIPDSTRHTMVPDSSRIDTLRTDTIRTH